MSVSPEARDALLGAADLLERDGWIQQSFSGDGGQRCVARAIFDAEGARRYNTGAYKAFGTAVDHRVVSEWNDKPGRTQAEVVAKLREVAAS